MDEMTEHDGTWRLGLSTVRWLSLLCLPLALSCGEQAPPADPSCPIDECGVTCFDESACGSCGNGTCEWFESLDACPSDCCDPSLCVPDGGPRYEAGDGQCRGADDGTRCDDGDLANGIETCIRGLCRHEHPHCRCMPPGGIFAEDPGPEPEVYEEPEPVTDRPWVGDEPSDPEMNDQWALRRINVSEAWQHTRGAGVTVGIVDSGCAEDVPDITGRVVAQTDIVGAEPAELDTDHGTFLASIVASAEDGAGMVGVAPEADLVCARVIRGESLDARAAQADVAEGIDWAVAQGAGVVLVGLAAVASTPELERAVADAVAADVVVVAPAGSEGGSHLDGFPAAYPGVISVAATDGFDLRDYGSDLSPATWLAAPGANIVGWHEDGSRGVASGSSPAAAEVAGAAALVRSAAPDLDAAQVRALLHARGAPIPMEGFDTVFRVRRLDAGAAVGAVAAGSDVHDVAVARAAFVAPSALPGEPAHARVRVENRGTVDATGIGVRATATGGTVATAAADVPDLGAGDTAEVSFDVVPDPGATEIELTVEVTAAGDTDATDDRLSATVPVGPEIHHRLQVERAEMAPPAAGESARTVSLTVENAGNVPEGPSQLFVGLEPQGEVQPFDVPALASGERFDLEVEVDPVPGAPEARHQVALYQRPAPGQLDLGAASAWLDYRWADEGNEEAELAYMQLKGHRLVADAPWRTVRGRIPVMVFYPRTRWLAGQHPDTPDVLELKFKGPRGGIQVNRIHIDNPTTPDATGRLIYDDYRTFTVRRWGSLDTTRHARPAVAPPGLVVVDENQVPVANQKMVINSPRQGAHRIAYIDTDALQTVGPCTPPCADHRPDPNTSGAWLRVTFEYRVFELRNSFVRWDRSSRTVFVAISDDDLPSMHTFSHYFDPHYHTVAEFFPGTYPLGPAQKYGGPLAMLSASAWALGITDRPELEGAFENVITTDHNTFFDDTYAPWGPAHSSRWGPVGSTATGSREMDVYRGLLGRTVGEEVSLQGERTGIMGRHSLLYDADGHVNGTWGTIDSYGGSGTPHCTPRLSNVLERISGGFDGMGAQGDCSAVGGIPDAVSGRNTPVIGGFLFAAHPYLGKMYSWSDAALHEASGLPPYNNDRFLRRTAIAGTEEVQRDYAFRGLQFWNSRGAQSVASNYIDYRFGTVRTQNPFVGGLRSIGPFHESCGTLDGTVEGYRADEAEHVASYLGLVRDGLGILLQEDDPPENRIFRKVFAVAGSDSHGDFNWAADFLSTRIQNLATLFGSTTYTDSGFARPRTYVFDDGDTPPTDYDPMQDLIHGRAVMTDGPVVDLAVDGEARGRWRGGRIAWHDDVDEFEDFDGRMGGEGNLDGGRTALIPYLVDAPPDDDDGQRVMIETRCRNIPDFGGSQPTRYELWVTGRPGTTEGPTRIDLLTGPERPSCDFTVHDRVVDLGNISEPRAVLAHVQVGDTCPAIYDAWTNPVWLAPVETHVPEIIFRDTDTTVMEQWCVEVTDTGPEAGIFELEFPISMMDEPVTALVAGVGTGGELLPFEGGADGMGALEPVTEGGSPNGWFASEDGRANSTRLRVSMPIGCAVEEDVLDPFITPARMLLIVARQGDDPRLRDAYGNPLGIFIARFEPRYAEYITDVEVVPVSGTRDFGIYHPMPPDDEATIVSSEFVDLATGADPRMSLFPGHSLLWTEGRRAGDPTRWGVHLILDGSGDGSGSKTWRYTLRWRR